jgi:hypothetical protein
MTRLALNIGIVLSCYLVSPLIMPVNKPLSRLVLKAEITSSSLQSNRYTFRVKISLQNPSDDTLRFIGSSCSMQDMFITNLDSLQVNPFKACRISFPMWYQINPGRSIEDSITVEFYGKTKLSPGTVFKLGYSYYERTRLKKLPRHFNEIGTKREIVWSQFLTSGSPSKPYTPLHTS